MKIPTKSLKGFTDKLVMKYLLAALLVSSCSSFRSPSSSGELATVTFRNQKLEKSFLRKTYSHLDEATFETKFQLSLERPLLFYRSYVNSFYSETQIKGHLSLVGSCMGDAHPENFGFISFSRTPYYVFNDIDDSGSCPIGLDILRYFSALKLTDISDRDFEKLAHLFEAYVAGARQESFNFKLPDLQKANEKNLKKNAEGDTFIAKGNLAPLPKAEKQRILKAIKGQTPGLEILDIASYTKSDGGSGGLKRYWLIVKTATGHKELIEFKEQVHPAVAWTGTEQTVARTATPQFIWGVFPDYYGYVYFDQTLFLTRTRADDFIDLGKLSSEDKFKLLSYQVYLIAKFHQSRLQSVGGIKAQWIIDNSQKVSERYIDAFNTYR